MRGSLLGSGGARPEPRAAGGGGSSQAQAAPPEVPETRAEPGKGEGMAIFTRTRFPRSGRFQGWAVAICWKDLRGERAAGGLSNHHFLYLSECTLSTTNPGSPLGEGKSGHLGAWEAGPAAGAFPGH